jgi:hypothetical protein
MALMRSGQKGLDEIQRVWAAMEGGNPVITEAQQGLIKRNAALLGRTGTPSSMTFRQKPRKMGACQQTSSNS